MVQGEDLLLVEDDAASREVMTVLLGAEGWTVHGAESGEAGLAWMRERRTAPAMVLCDLNLPGTCGSELAEALRLLLQELPRGHRCGVMSMTASVGRWPCAGYDGELLKPFAAAAVEAAWRIGGMTGGMAAEEEAVADEVGGSILDQAVLEKLRAAMGDTAMRGMYAFALADAGERLARMRSAVLTGDGSTYVREAHALKGSCGMVGARRLGKSASNAEMESLDVDATEKVSRMFAEMEEVRLMLETLLHV